MIAIEKMIPMRSDCGTWCSE